MALLYIALAGILVFSIGLTAATQVSAHRFREALKQPRDVTSDAPSLLWKNVQRPADVLFFTSAISLALVFISAVLGIGHLTTSDAVQPLASIFLFSTLAVSVVGASGVVVYYKLFDTLKDAAVAEQKDFLAKNGLEAVSEGDLSESFPVHAEAAEGNGPDAPKFAVRRLSDGTETTAFFRLRDGKVSLVVVP